ncbi:TonB-dependent receptor plug domain-containing protein [Halosquirtibacter laminarini]|uniref:TonB-dependent receptor plug domain-containing protein n=1 Tax=Halosquirtibacter laminarini TaxID=3374600 RepID=A0AC61NC27_9BACT|nr:TonB-dependent receptor plug domain-containing protein [Prolixibacteraceae bacterium]
MKIQSAIAFILISMPFSSFCSTYRNSKNNRANHIPDVVKEESTLNRLDSIQSNGQSNTKFIIRDSATLNVSKLPIYIVDGKTVSSEAFAKINTSNIESVEILKDAKATAIYGTSAKNGVILIKTKGKKETTSVKTHDPATPISKMPIYIVDGKHISSETFAKINTNNIESVEVLKDAKATAIYGTSAKNGVIIIKTKENKENTTFKTHDPATPMNKMPIYIVDGKPVSSEAFAKINTNNIESVEVLKDAKDTAIYGTSAENGVIIIKMKDPQSKTQTTLRCANADKSKLPIFILDGKPITQKEFEKLNPDNLKSVEILKNKKDTAIYGTSAKNGVMIMKTKDSKTK